MRIWCLNRMTWHPANYRLWSHEIQLWPGSWGKSRLCHYICKQASKQVILLVLQLLLKRLWETLRSQARFANIWRFWLRRNMRVYYSLAVWRFQPTLSAGLRFHLHLSDGLRLRNYRAVAENHKFSLQFSILRVFVAVIQTELRGSEDWAVTLSCLKILSLTKDCLLRLDQVSQGFPLCPRPRKGGWGR